MRYERSEVWIMIDATEVYEASNAAKDISSGEAGYEIPDIG